MFYLLVMEAQSQDSVAAGSPAEVPNDPGKMFIGGLSWQTSPGPIENQSPIGHKKGCNYHVLIHRSTKGGKDGGGGGGGFVRLWNKPGLRFAGGRPKYTVSGGEFGDPRCWDLAHYNRSSSRDVNVGVDYIFIAEEHLNKYYDVAMQKQIKIVIVSSKSGEHLMWLLWDCKKTWYSSSSRHKTLRMLCPWQQQRVVLLLLSILLSWFVRDQRREKEEEAVQLTAGRSPCCCQLISFLTSAFFRLSGFLYQRGKEAAGGGGPASIPRLLSGRDLATSRFMENTGGRRGRAIVARRGALSSSSSLGLLEGLVSLIQVSGDFNARTFILSLSKNHQHK
ncbi:hypothetical protein B566_EDAN015162 [Ephemera danica]|nr:hypothetical protein B566_EDAN015162 [Ephemera danica]